MKLRKETKAIESDITLDPNGIYEIGGYGVLIEFWPKNRQLVKNAITGRIMDKKNSYPCGRDPRGNFYYLPIGVKLDGIDLEVLIASNFNELRG